MAKNTQPIAKRCKALGISPAVMGYAKKNTTRNSNGNMRKKQSEYATQLKEKQKVKFIYGVLEKQFHNAYLKAEAMPGKTGENLLQLMERRLDNVVFRLGFAQTRRDARQLVSHAHFTVNGKKVNIPSYLIKAGDVIEVRESSRSSAKFAKLTGPEAPVVALPSWLDREAGTLKGVVNKLPERSDIDYEVAEHLIVELYSKRFPGLSFPIWCGYCEAPVPGSTMWGRGFFLPPAVCGYSSDHDRSGHIRKSAAQSGRFPRQ